MPNLTGPLAQLKDPSIFKTDALVNGQWVAGASRFDVLDPATGEKLADVANLGAADAQAAIAAANAAWPAWRSKTAKERSNKLYAWFELIMTNQDELARIMTCEQGKPLAEARGEVAYGASFIQWFSEEGKRAYGRTIPGFSGDRRLATIKQPVGVVAAITPWNFPIAIPAWKIAPALAFGNCVVLRPADLVPGSAWALAEIISRSGLPAGAFNLVLGSGRRVGQTIVESPLVDAISFTGSVPVGEALLAIAPAPTAGLRRRPTSACAPSSVAPSSATLSAPHSAASPPTNHMSRK